MRGGQSEAGTVLHRLPIDDPSQFAFVDLGCGKCRTLILAAEHGFRPVIGVELDLPLTGIARSSAETVATAAAWLDNRCGCRSGPGTPRRRRGSGTAARGCPRTCRR
jgi:hypothetical protein